MRIGKIMILLGSALLLAALALFLFNTREQEAAAQSSAEVMPKLVEVIYDRAEAGTQPIPAHEPGRTMPIAEVDGRDYIGFLGIPALELELPVMADWDYDLLQIAPCRYTGDLYQENLVLMAHNYEKHFGKLSKLRPGDEVTFTDMDGNTQRFAVIALDVLPPDAKEEMSAGEYDLTLFTCTYGGQSRVTVRCDRTEN